MVRIGGLEAGGTKMVCAVGDEYGEVIEKETFETLTPEKTLPELIDFFKRHRIDGLGIGSFGPIDLDEKNYGVIGNTPKIDWIGASLYEAFSKALHVPISITTDVNAAAYAEANIGAARGLDNCLYITVGTGIGAGAIVNGEILQGFTHPEMGHIYVRRAKEDSFKGNCPYHEDCLEGMASGPAIEARWGEKGVNLAGRKEVWGLESHYLSEAICQYTLMIMPKRIVMGGGVMKQEEVFPYVRSLVRAKLANYVTLENIDDYIVPAKLGDEAGVKGALLIGKKLIEK